MSDYRIYKYPLAIADGQTIDAPMGLKPLSVQFQHDQLCLWAMVDIDEETTGIPVHVVGTGNSIPEYVIGSTYVGTVQHFDGELVWHVFVDTTT